jgi:hypothetical protein
MLYTTNEEYLNEIIKMAEKMLEEVADEESEDGLVVEAHATLECAIEDYQTEGFNFGNKYGAEKYDPS